MIKKIIIIYIFVTLAVLLFLPGIRVAHDFPYVYPDVVLQGLSLPQVWSDNANGLGQSTILTLWSWPIGVLYGTGTYIGIEFSALAKLFGIVPAFVVGVLGINYFLKSYGFSPKARWIPGVFYLTNTYFLLLIDGGQLAVALAFSWFPLAYTLFEKSPKRVLAALSVVVLGFFDIRFLYILAILIGLRVLYLRKLPREWVVKGLLVLLFFLLLNIYWILPALFERQNLNMPIVNGVNQASWLSFTNIGHALLILQPHWWSNQFGIVTPLRPEFYILTFLAFFALFVKSKNKDVNFWFLVAVVAAFLVKGTNPPFEKVYSLFFTYIPGFSLFRDSTKFFFILVLAYTFLIGITTQYLIKKKYIFRAVVALFVIYVFSLMLPFLKGNMNGILSQPPNQNLFMQTSQYFSTDNSFSRILWLPSRPLLGYGSIKHPLVEGFNLAMLRPFAAGTVGTYESLNFIREMPLMGQLFDVAGIGYVAYPYPDPRREPLNNDQNEYYFTFFNQLKSLPWTGQLISDYPVPVIKTNTNQDRFFIADNTYFVVGSDRMYWDLADKKNFGLADNALIFAEEFPGILKETIKFPNAKVVNYHKNPLDAQMALVDGDKFVFPAKQLNFEPDSSGWWKRETPDLVWWKNFLQQKYNIFNLDFDYGGGWAVAEGNLELVIKDEQFVSGETLYARVMESSGGGTVSFYQDGNLIGSIDTKVEKPNKVQEKLTGYKEIPDQAFEYDGANVRWFELGNLQNDSPVKIVTSGDINVINALASINKSDLVEIDYQKFEDVDFSGKSNAKISYTRIAPTHYKIKIAGLESPSTLVFSETFDPFWELNGQKSTKVYSFLNGFYIEKDGEYDLYFEPQKYVLPGLFISLITLGVVIVLIRRK